jgi:26S proteasome regulatory subunit N6
LNAKLAQKYKQLVEVEAMVSVANAQKNRSLNEFESSLTTFKKQLAEDPIIKGHLEDLYNTLLEQNLCRIIEPYSRVQIAFIAQQVKLPPSQVEKKLSQMILDKLFNGILDQSKGTLCVYDYSEADVRRIKLTLENIRCSCRHN